MPLFVSLYGHPAVNAAPVVPAIMVLIQLVQPGLPAVLPEAGVGGQGAEAEAIAVAAPPAIDLMGMAVADEGGVAAIAPPAVIDGPAPGLGGDALVQLGAVDGSGAGSSSELLPHHAPHDPEGDNINTAFSGPCALARVGARLLAVLMWITQVFHHTLRCVYLLSKRAVTTSPSD